MRLPPAVVLGVKDAFASRSRAAMTIASLALTMGGDRGAGHRGDLPARHPDPSLRAKPYELIVDANDVTRATRALLGAQSARVAGTATVAGTTRCRAAPSMWARAVGGDYRAPYAVRDGRMIAGPGEAIVGRGLLDALGLHVGDRLPLEAEGARLDLRIVGRYVEPDNDGRTAIFDPPLSRPLAASGPAVAIQLHRRADAHPVHAIVQSTPGAVEASR